MGTLPEGFSHIPDFLSVEEHDALVERLRGLHYEHAAYGPRKRESTEELKRGYVQFGWEYSRAGDQRSEPKPLPDFLAALVTRARKHCPPGTEFNQAVAMHYPDGTGIGWHTDGQRFGPCVMAVSLGTAATMQFRPNGSGGHERSGAGAAIVLPADGAFRWDYEHQIPAVGHERFSLTFRHIAQGQAAD